MSDLLTMQNEFMAHVLQEERELPSGWTARHEAGMAIYRGGYRARMVDTIAETFERTRALAGEEAFRQAAINHVISSPSSGWSIDDVGSGFSDSLRDLFPDRPDLAELAEIEESMQTASGAADAAPLSVEAFAQTTAAFDEQGWADLRLEFLPGLDLVPVEHAWPPIWAALSEGGDQVPPDTLEQPQCLVVWREDEQPVFVALSQAEGETLRAMQDGACFAEAVRRLAGQIGAEEAASQAGGMVGHWLQSGLVAGLR